MSKRVFLASQSPRRLELLRQIGLEAMVLPLRHAGGRADVDETPLEGEAAKTYVLRLARLKVEAGCRALAGRNLPPWPVLAADTTVSVDRRILGKPANLEEAADMLRAYAGRSHRVLTAVAVSYQGQLKTAVSISHVRFGPLTEAEIQSYAQSREPFDKAGGYGIQGRAALFIEHISGSYSGVMGLPLYETGLLLKEVGFEIG
ncbi:MAG: Maf family protein [Pseudomonadota bacterium]